jgi:hypothetical protein
MGELAGLLAILIVIIGIPLIMAGVALVVGLSTILIYGPLSLVVSALRGLWRLIRRPRPRRVA